MVLEKLLRVEAIKKYPEDEELLEEDCFTAAGWALEALGHIPTQGEVFTVNGAVVTVEEMDDKRILSLLVHIPAFVPGEQKEGR